MLKYVIFDIDGTIIDSELVILKSLQQVLKEEGMDYKIDDLKFSFGIPGFNSLQKLNVKDIDRVLNKWAKTILDFSHEIKPFPGIVDVLKHLSASPVRTGIVTSKTKQEFVEGFVPHGLNTYFDCVITASDTENHKPHPEPLLACMRRLQANPEQTVYIGDAIYDLQCAKDAGVKFGLALWGAKTTEGFETADFIFTEPKDILNLI